MDDDFDNDMGLPEDDLNESLGELGDLGDVDAGLEGPDFDETSELGGTRSSGGARARSSMSDPDAGRAPKAAKRTVPMKAAAKTPAPKKAAPKKAAPKKAAKKAPPKKKAKAVKTKAKPRKTAKKAAKRKK